MKQTTNEPTTTPPVAYSKKPWPLLLLYFFGTGLVGGHRFYLGKWRTGVVQAVMLLMPLLLLFCAEMRWTLGLGGLKTIVLAGFFFLAAVGWCLIDCFWLLFRGPTDKEGHRVRTAKGEWRFLRRSLLLFALILCVQLAFVLYFYGGWSAFMKVFQSDAGFSYVQLGLCLWGSWVLSYTAIYVWEEWFVIKEMGLLLLLQPLSLLYLCSLVLWVDLVIMFAYLDRWLTDKDSGASVFWSFVFSLRTLLFVLGFVVFCGVWVLGCMALSFVRKTDLCKEQSRPVWLLLAAFTLSFVALGHWDSVLAWSVVLVLAMCGVVLMAPPFRQKMGKGKPAHGQVRPVVSFSLLGLFVVGTALILDYGGGYLRHIRELQKLKLQNSLLLPSSEALQGSWGRWPVVVLAAVCLVAAMGRLLWLHRKQFRWAVVEARWTLLSFVVGPLLMIGVVFGMRSWILKRFAGNVYVYHHYQYKRFQRAPLSSAVRKAMSLELDTIQIDSLLAVAQFFFGKRKRFERVWVGPKKTLLLDHLGSPVNVRDHDQIQDKVPATLAAVIKRYRVLTDQVKKKGKRRLVLSVEPMGTMAAVCRVVHEAHRQGLKDIRLQLPVFRRAIMAGKTFVLIPHWRTFSLLSGKQNFTTSPVLAKDELYNKRLTAASRQKRRTLRLCRDLPQIK